MALAGITDPRHITFLEARFSVYGELQRLSTPAPDTSFLLEAARISANFSVDGSNEGQLGLSDPRHLSSSHQENISGMIEAGFIHPTFSDKASPNVTSEASGPEFAAVINMPNLSFAHQFAFLQRLQAAKPQRCVGFTRLEANTRKHTEEISKMLDPRHVELIPLVESALAMMR